MDFRKGDKVVFVLGCSPSNFFHNYRGSARAQRGDKGMVTEASYGGVKVILNSGKQIRIPSDHTNSYIIHDMSLLNAIDGKQNLKEGTYGESWRKTKVSKDIDNVGDSLVKLSKLVNRTWSPIKKRELEKKLEKEIKSLTSLKKLLKSIDWEEDK